MSPKVAIIGAGASGLAAIKNCLDYGFDPVCFEKTDYIGGLWRYKDGACDGEATVMHSTILNTSKEMTAFSDFPAPDHFPNFMRNNRVCEYLEMYAREFKLHKYIRLQTKVCSIDRRKPDEDTDGWMVSYRGASDGTYAQVEHFDAVFLCTGHHVEPHIPRVSGLERFEGRVLHSHDYKDQRGFEERRVLVVGLGNSAGDIVVELGRAAKQVFCCSRFGTWMIQRVADGGYPYDVLYKTRFRTWLNATLPAWLSTRLAERRMNKRFNHHLYGLAPQHGAGQSPTLLADDLPLHLACGWVVLKPAIKHFATSGVVFSDGTSESIDDVIFCTGYSFEFPYVEGGTLIPVRDNQVRLYRRIYPTSLDAPSLAVIGLADPMGPTIAMSEMQSRAACHLLASGTKLPPRVEMEAYVDGVNERLAKQFKCSARRYSLQVDYIPYMDELAEVIGAKPRMGQLWMQDPQLAMLMTFGPCTGSQYRLQDTPFGALPVLYIDTEPLADSVAIADYLGRQFGLAGSNAIEASRCVSYDNFVENTIYSLWQALARPIVFEDNVEKAAENYPAAMSTTVKTHLGIFEKLLKKNGDWLVGSKLSWADLHAAYLHDCLREVFDTKLLEDYPLLKAHVKRVFGQPKIKAYRKTRPNGLFMCMIEKLQARLSLPT